MQQQHDGGDKLNKPEIENVKTFSQILENPDEDDLNKWLEDNLTNDIASISEITSLLSDTFFGPLSPFHEPRHNNAENFQVLLSVQKHINEQVSSENQHFVSEIEKTLNGKRDDLLKFMHAVTILWKTEMHGPGETPRFPPDLIRHKLDLIREIDEKIASFLLDRMIVNILWPIHREHVDGLSIEEIEEFLYSFSKQDFSDESLKYFSKTYFNHYFKDGDERVNGLRNASSNDEFSKGFTNYLIASRLSIDDPRRTPMLLQALDSFIDTNDHQRQSAILARLMRAGIDLKGEDGEYNQIFNEYEILQRMISILQILDPNVYSERVINSVVNEIVEYLMFRIRRNNQQCMSCNRFHAEQPRMAIDDLDKIDDFHKIANGYERITEIVGILQLIRDGKTEIQPVENPLLERWMSEIEDHEQVLSIYSVETCDVNYIIYSSLGCILHAASNHLNDDNAKLITNELLSQLNSRKNGFTSESMRDFVVRIINIITEITSFDRANWREELNLRLSRDLDKFILERNITKEEFVYAVELHRTMYPNEEIHPKHEENFYHVFLFIEYIIDNFDNEGQYPEDLLKELQSMKNVLHASLTTYIDAISRDEETSELHSDRFGFTLERLEEIQGKLQPKEE